MPQFWEKNCNTVLCFLNAGSIIAGGHRTGEGISADPDRKGGTGYENQL